MAKKDPWRLQRKVVIVCALCNWASCLVCQDNQLVEIGGVGVAGKHVLLLTLVRVSGLPHLRLMACDSSMYATICQ